MPPIQALLFDLDGTLVDSEELGMDVLFEAAQQLGLTLSREQAHAQFRGRQMGHCIAFIAAGATDQTAAQAPGFAHALTAQVRREQATRFRACLRALPGALDLVQALTIPFCVATNGPREKAELTLGLTGLLPYFENRLFCAYEVGSFKPEPGLFLHAAAALGVAPEHCAVVEDSLPGIEAGLAAGMRVFSLYPEQDLPDHLKAQVQSITGLHELGRWLRERPGCLV